MDKSLAQRLLAKIGLAIFVIATLDLVFINWWIIQNNTILSEWQNEKIKNQNLEQNRQVNQESLVSPSPSPDLASSSVSAPSPSPIETKTVVEKETQTIVQNAQKEIFIPMGSGSTTSNSYADLSGVEVTIDTTKYSTIDSVVFEASVWVEGGNGRAWAQLLNVSEKTAYIESQISNSTSTPTVKTSGKIPFANGQKTYRAQAKTDITNFPAHVDNARIKITLR